MRLSTCKSVKRSERLSVRVICFKQAFVVERAFSRVICSARQDVLKRSVDFRKCLPRRPHYGLGNRDVGNTKITSKTNWKLAVQFGE